MQFLSKFEPQREKERNWIAKASDEVPCLSLSWSVISRAVVYWDTYKSMKEVDKKGIVNSKQRKSTAKSANRDQNVREKKGSNTLKAKEIDKASSAKTDFTVRVSDSNMGREPSEVYENLDIHYMNDVYRFEEAYPPIEHKMVDKEIKDKLNGHSSDLEKGTKEEMAEDSDLDTFNDSVSSQGNPVAAEYEKVERASRIPRTLAKNDSSDGSCHSERASSKRRTNKLQTNPSKITPTKLTKPDKGPSKATAKAMPDNLKNIKVPQKPESESSEGIDGKPFEETKEADVLDEGSRRMYNVIIDDEPLNAEETDDSEDKAALGQKIEEMESRIEKLEEELREVAALEIALYSVIPEHGISAHKVHTPARRLCRLYIHASKYWSPDKRATVARNTVSGLVLIAKSCSNDVPRLAFWLSNTVVLRDIVSQAFGSSCQLHPPTNVIKLNGIGKKTDARFSSLKWKSNPGSREPTKQGVIQMVEDWQETRTFTAALEKVESWIFSRIVESIWWQTLTPNMQSPTNDPTTSNIAGTTIDPNLGDQQLGSFSINLWKNAFQDALGRLCPIRAGGHECGCLPVLARKVMEQCLARLDVAMFNAILRESAHEIPTDPVSDPIVDSKVLPIPAGYLSFGSGAQLKNSVGNWSRWLNDFCGTGATDSAVDNQKKTEDDDRQDGDETNCFDLLNALSDLLMLPKDLLIDRAIRMEVCPQISLPLLKRILCNFTPDEFCPDTVPGAVLEALNAESIIEYRTSGDSDGSFPYTAAPVVYTPPTLVEVADKVAEAGGKLKLPRSASEIQRKGYSSDEDLLELDCPLETIVGKMSSSPTNPSSGNGNMKQEDETDYACANARYELLREVWSAT